MLESLSALPEKFAIVLAAAISYLALLIIGIGIISALVNLVIVTVSPKKTFHGELNTIRLQLGRYLLLGLEFLIGKDIILSIFDGNLSDLINLSLLILIRVVLSFFLHRELRDIKLHREI